MQICKNIKGEAFVILINKKKQYIHDAKCERACFI